MAGHGHRGQHRRRIGVAARQRHHRTADWRSAAERHRARAAVAARHGGRKDAHADQPRIQRQRGVRGRARHVAVMVACVGPSPTGGDRERCDCRACSHGDRARAPASRIAVAARQRHHHRAADWRRAGECHCAGASRRAADQYGRVHGEGTQQRVHDEPDLIWRCHRKWR